MKDMVVCGDCLYGLPHCGSFAPMSAIRDAPFCGIKTIDAQLRELEVTK